jgi:hypothetical protein
LLTFRDSAQWKCPLSSMQCRGPIFKDGWQSLKMGPRHRMEVSEYFHLTTLLWRNCIHRFGWLHALPSISRKLKIPKTLCRITNSSNSVW